MHDFLASIQNKHSRSAAKTDLEKFQATGLPLDKDGVRQFTALMIAEGLSPQTINRRLATLRKYVEWSGEALFPIRGVPKSQPLPKIVRNPDRIIAEADERDRLIFELLYTTGLRVSELLNLRWEDIDFDNAEILVTAGKGNKQRVVLTTEEVAIKLLLLYTDGATPKDKIFTVCARTIQRRAKRYGTQPHAWRHTFAVNIVEESDADTAQRLLGHQNATTTQIYTRLATKQLRNNYNKAFGNKERMR